MLFSIPLSVPIPYYIYSTFANGVIREGLSKKILSIRLLFLLILLQIDIFSFIMVVFSFFIRNFAPLKKLTYRIKRKEKTFIMRLSTFVLAASICFAPPITEHPSQ